MKGADNPVRVPAMSATLESVQADELDIDALYSAHAAFLGRVIQKLAGNGAVEDVLQEAFIIAWKKRATLRRGAPVRPWLYGIAANLAKNHRRGLFRFLRAKERFSLEPPAPMGAPGDALEKAEARARVHAALAKLPFKQREVFVLFEIEELEGNVIAEMVGAPIGTVWTRLHHARKHFTTSMKESG